MIVLGIDPGPAKCGWALLDFSVLMSPVWHCGGVTEDVLDMLDTFTASGALVPELVGIEQPRSLHNPMANVQAMATAWAGGRVEGLAQARGFETAALGVNEWRQALIGHSKRGDNIDHKVEHYLRTFVRQMPKRTSVHCRDAAGVACIAARRWKVSMGIVSTHAVRELGALTAHGADAKAGAK